MHEILLPKSTTEAFAEWQPPALLPFHWHVYDVGSVLPAGWDTALLDVAHRTARRHSFRPTMSTAREVPDVEISLETVSGEELRREAPWLHELYGGWFRDLARRLADEELHTTSTLNRALSLNILRGDGERYPCHVDSNPMQGLLYLTDMSEETGGALVVARDRGARNVDEVNADCGVIYPRRGQLYFFDARAHAHYVEPMRHDDALRAVVTMNYYSPSCPETARPAGLDEQLFRR
ncbi:2OG-Fe(II) oxygenase [Micromonospora chokoriensis]|uniref:2OG-Fe(II) oxygenase n=1 Tax=Micromonospora chokoriensis TaxID=356851 RepID=UPI0004C44B06|nr:2OG-Fe(II) oxygenase [Micromonospora chokoriensis]